MADTIKPAHHAWDHLPGGEDPIRNIASGPYAIIVWDAGGGPVPVDTAYNLSPSAGSDLTDIAAWDFGYSSDASEMVADYANGRIAPFTSAGVRQGTYLIHLAVGYSENWANGDLWCAINLQGGTSMDIQQWQTQTAYAKTANHFLQDGETVQCTVLVTINTTSTSNCYFTGAFGHSGGGGSSRSLEQVTLTAVRLGAYPVDTGAFVP
jgi:hypothetical protein